MATQLLAAAALLSSAVRATVVQPARAEELPPKAVVFVLVDDWGFNDVGFRSTDLKTPFIDSLAATGVKLMNYYTQPICTPARTALMTARYPIRSGMWHNVIGVPSEPWGLPTNESTWAEGMRELGFSTHTVGKVRANGRRTRPSCCTLRVLPAALRSRDSRP
jgi:arylsulfatase I/J